MYIISGNSFDISVIANEYDENSVEKQLLNKMSASSEKYSYASLDQLKFELNLRKNIVKSAVSLGGSGLSFSVFKKSVCNPVYWTRTPNGGFLLKEKANSGEAINDIYMNGNKYATECATAMMIVYYKALLDAYGGELFNKQFTKIYLLGWEVTEPLLAETASLQPAADMLLGDREYFNNPDYDPAAPEWEGENVIILPDSMYYGHGIGITAAGEIIRDLNSNRKEYASRSAYLVDAVGRPNFNKLSDVYYDMPREAAPLVWKPFPSPLIRNI
jgi:protein-glutamine gamma-glutamyltransferase